MVGQTLRWCGLAIVLLSAALVAQPRGLAYAQEAVQTVIDQTPGPSPAPDVLTPETPGPPPPPPRLHAGGPILFNFTGALSLGHSQTSSTYGGGPIFTPSPSPSSSATPLFPFQQSSSNQTNQASGGMQAEFSRRTGTTLTDVRIPIGAGTTGGAQLGLISLLYSTPKYSIGYGPQPLNAFGQLQLGATLRGFSLILPVGLGQETFFQGPTTGAQGNLARLLGYLLLQARGPMLYEAGFSDASGPGTGQAKTLVLGGALNGGNSSMTAEAAWQSISGGIASPHGLAYQMRYDDFANGATGFSFTFRRIPDQFIALGTGEIYSDRYLDANFHTGSAQSIFTDVNWERTGDASTGVTQQRTESLGFISPTKIGATSITLQRQDLTSEGVPSSVEQATLQLTPNPIAGITASFGGQLQRSDQAGITNSTRALLATIGRPFGSYNVGFSFQNLRQTQGDIGVPTLITGFSANASRTFGKTSIQLNDSITHTVSATSDAIQRTPTVNVLRQISPAISVGASLGYQTLRDKLNPAANGKTRIFSLQLSAPFSYGNSVVSGRIDPRLPATIVGKIQATSGGAYGGSSVTFGGTNGGIGNVAVILDDREIQRTDLTGGFQFSFVAPGQHQIRIDTSSIPRGLTVSTPVQTLTIQGGQLAQVYFTVGTFGGVLGHIYGLDGNGNKIPLPNVQLRVDGGAYAQTDSTGAYGFGGLAPGEHDIAVIPQTIPAFADFSPDQLHKAVDVANGQYATLDFTAQPLGSISGKIVFGPEMAPTSVGGVSNAYVVAEPGEHAAIDSDDGSFIIDNLPAGDYTVSVDPETLDEGLGAAPESISVHLEPAQHAGGLEFKVGRFEKKVVFSFVTGGNAAAPPQVHLTESRLPPRGTTPVSVNAPATSKAVTVTAFGKTVSLAYSKANGRWVGQVEVPKGTEGGDYTVEGRVEGGVKPQSATLQVDPSVPLAILQFTPANAAKGQTVTVRARFLLDVRPGDRIDWEDGTVTTLGKPVSGRVFTFNLRLSLRPLHGVLLTRQGGLPIELL